MKKIKIFIPVDVEAPNASEVLISGETLRLVSSAGLVSSDKAKITYLNDCGYETTWAREKEMYCFTEEELRQIIRNALIDAHYMQNTEKNREEYLDNYIE